MMADLRKYPRTYHIEGSRTQPGDENLEAMPFRVIAGRYLVVEEKVDGANAAISFDTGGQLLLQSRGHYLTGGPRERHFALFKQWANVHAGRFHEVLGTRFVLYGEWLYAKHTIFYDRLRHYFLEFDVLDTKIGEFLSTSRRREMLSGLPLASVPVLHSGPVRSVRQLAGFVGPSAFIAEGHQERLRGLAEERGLDAGRVLAETDRSVTMEGLYLKVEERGAVVARYKYVRPSFLQAVLEAGDHWLDRPIVPNQLRSDVDIFAEQLP
jgi:hypothetical protein